jgi:hypothetical protein
MIFKDIGPPGGFGPPFSTPFQMRPSKSLLSFWMHLAKSTAKRMFEIDDLFMFCSSFLC